LQERLEREHDLSLIMTAPTVIYTCTKTNGTVEEVSNPSALPDIAVRESIAEPYVKMEVITPSEYNGQLMQLCESRRGAGAMRVLLVVFHTPLCCIVGGSTLQVSTRVPVQAPVRTCSTCCLKE
jgi:translation elongation factor EF-4